MFFTLDDVRRFARVLRSLEVSVSDELRGWRWEEPPIRPSYGVQLTVSDVSGGFCETGRYVFLKYVKRLQGVPSPQLLRGRFIHDVISEAHRFAKMIIYRGILNPGRFRRKFMRIGVKVYRNLSKGLKGFDHRGIFKLLWRSAADTFSSSLARIRSQSPYLRVDSIASLAIPAHTEYPVDGSLIGLTRGIRIDAILPPAVLIEFKTREIKPESELGLAGYALAFENQYEIPVNHGVLIKLDIDEERSDFKVYEKLVPIVDSLRAEFLNVRENLAQIVEMQIDPGVSSTCDKACPYWGVCHGG